MLSLIKRLVLGHKITPAQEDQNMTDIENAINGFAAELAVSLNPDGTLKNNTVSTAAIQDRAVTLAKLAFQSLFYAVDSGAVNAMAISFTPAATAYAAGMGFFVKAVANNTGACTLKVDALAAVAIKVITNSGLADPIAGNILAGGVYIFIHDGTQFVCCNPNTPASVNGLVFFDSPVTLFNSTAAAWTGVDIGALVSGSGQTLPAAATGILLASKINAGPPAGGDAAVLLAYRKSALSPIFTVGQIDNRSGDSIAVSAQASVPLANDRNCEIEMVTGGFAVATATGQIDLIGYYA